MLDDLGLEEVDEETAEIFKERQANPNGLVVIPWVFKSGFVNNTETGYVPVNAKPSDYSYFESIFTGKENIQVIWEDSTKLVKPKGVNRYNYVFQVGKYYFGSLISGQTSQGVEIDNVTDNEDFLAMKDFQSVKLRFDFPPSTLIEDNTLADENQHYFFPKEEDRRKLYTIPEICGNKWLMITDITLHTGTTKSDIVAVEITFTSVGDKIRKSGRATEQFIQYGAAGDSWCLPTVRYNYDENNHRTKVVGYERHTPTPVTHFQVEMLGAGAISSITIWGRKLHLNPSTGLYYFEEYKFLLPYEFATPQNNDINRTSTPSKNLFFFPNETLELVTTKNWDQAWKDQNNSVAVNNQAGRLTMSNKEDWSSLEEGSHSSNGVISGGSVRYDYFDEAWKPTAWLGGAADQPELSCNGNMYTEDTLSYSELNSAIDILVTNSFAYLNQLELPLGFKSSKPYKINNMPIIGGMISAIIGDRTLNSKTKERAPMRVGYFMDCDLAGYLVNRGVIPEQGDKTVSCFVNNLCGEDIANWLGVECCNLSFCFSLTDRISINTHGMIWGGVEGGDTKYIGQNKDENGNYLFDDHLPLLYSTRLGTKVKKPVDGGFVIDKVLVQGFFAGKIRLSAYNIHNNDLSTPVWTTTVLSTAKWTGSLRNWTTEITTGGWDDRFIDREDEFTWPEYPSKKTGDQWYIGWNSPLEKFQFSYDISGRNPQLAEKGFTNSIRVDNKYQHDRHDHNYQRYSIEYAALGITNVTDRASFFANVEAMRLNYRGTEAKMWFRKEFWRSETSVSAEEKTHFVPLDPRQTEYNLDLGVIAFDYDDGHVLSNDVSWEHEFLAVSGEEGGTTAHFPWQTRLLVKPHIYIQFEEDTIELQVGDYSTFYDREEKPTGYSNFTFQCNAGGVIRTTDLQYNLCLHHLEFINKNQR